MKIAVSACLLGRNCKYNGGNNRSQAVPDFLKGHAAIPVCPEVTGGLPVPRVPVELQNGRAINKNGEDVTVYFRRGVEQTMARLSAEGIDLAILQPRSPSCGCREIYDGSFSGKKISGKGLFAQALADAGIPLQSAEEIENI